MHCVAVAELDPHLVLDLRVEQVAIDQPFDESRDHLEFMIVLAGRIVLLFVDALPEADEEAVYEVLRKLEALD
jgi:hypothetical protein